MVRMTQSATEIADALIETIGKHIVLGLPVGIGKATHIADALFERAAADASISLTIFTGLTLEPPRGRNDAERRFLEPLIERLYADWPTPNYAQALRERSLPTNVAVHEFYLRPGAYLGHAGVQQSYASINYSQVTAELVRLGVTVIAQLVSATPERPEHVSLASNPEITLDLLPRLEAQQREGRAVAMVGQVNRRLPYMAGDAELERSRFDWILDSDELEFPLFGLPSRRVLPADYATAMHVASLVPDGGTLQVGIGSLSDAVAHCLRLRHEAPEVFRTTLARLPGGSESARRSGLPLYTEPFEQGLFASSELLSDALFSLFECGVVRRPADETDPSVIHAGFFVGSADFYARLRNLDDARRGLINMTSISAVNTLHGDEVRKRAQRRDAVFVNETMMVTLLGAAVSDALADGRVVSGVGGQFDFVSMALELEGAHSVLICRARRMAGGVPESNIRWNYAHATVPRHHRDIFVSEYGIAATRGRSDRDVVVAMLGIADAEFQDELATSARDAGKLEAGYRMPDDGKANTPATLHAVFADPALEAHFPPYPLGTDFTATERELIDALDIVQDIAAQPLRRPGPFLAAVLAGGRERPDALARMGLEKPSGIRERVFARLLLNALERQS